MATSARRALIAATFVVAGVVAFLLAYSFIGAGPRGGQESARGAGTRASAGAAEAVVQPSGRPDGAPAPRGPVSHAPWQPGPSPLPPSSVGPLRLASNTMSDFTVAWDPAVDDTGIRCYRVLVNGFLADTTNATHATLPWLAGRDPILVQVAAVDLDGNYGEWSALYVIPPPEPVVNRTTAASTTAGPTTAPTSSAPTAAAASSGRASPAPASPSPSASATSPAPSTSTASTTTASPSPTASATPTATATASSPSSASASPSPSASPGL